MANYAQGQQGIQPGIIISGTIFLPPIALVALMLLLAFVQALNR